MVVYKDKHFVFCITCKFLFLAVLSRITMNSAVISISFTMVVMLTFMRMATSRSLVKEDYYKSKRGLTPGIAGYGPVSPDTPAVPPYTAAGASAVSVPLTPAAAPLSPVDSFYTAAIRPVYLTAYAPAVASPYVPAAFAPAVASPHVPAAFAPAVASPYVPAAPSYVPAAPAEYAPAAAKAPLGFSIYG
ncbi:DNA-directed RNA polymerase II subunit 1-like [Cryptotermes secundus]|uniref:DNA-directed RNA polymerase II subunit 1-like n=1 Tax=Cryptotermes secundus TaxID=105785 RepID=UPI000CD7D1C3|nr:DNA-directed RNA polymerase II subunit 1-like [Cryptotermes secundus]